MSGQPGLRSGFQAVQCYVVRDSLKKSPRLMEITNCVSLKYSVPIGAPLAKRTSLSQYAFLCSPTCSWFLSFVDGTSCIDHSVSPRPGSPLCAIPFNGHT